MLWVAAGFTPAYAKNNEGAHAGVKPAATFAPELHILGRGVKTCDYINTHLAVNGQTKGKKNGKGRKETGCFSAFSIFTVCVE